MTKISMVRREGGSRVISVSKVIPEDWIAVEITATKMTKTTVILKIEKVK